MFKYANHPLFAVAKKTMESIQPNSNAAIIHEALIDSIVASPVHTAENHEIAMEIIDYILGGKREVFSKMRSENDRLYRLINQNHEIFKRDGIDILQSKRWEKATRVEQLVDLGQDIERAIDVFLTTGGFKTRIVIQYCNHKGVMINGVMASIGEVTAIRSIIGRLSKFAEVYYSESGISPDPFIETLIDKSTAVIQFLKHPTCLDAVRNRVTSYVSLAEMSTKK